MSRKVKTEAIVLKKKNLPNNDYIFTFLSEEFGKIKLFAKGVKKITSKRLPHLQTGNLIEGLIYKKDNRFYLEETKIISFFSKIKSNSYKISQLYFYLFVLERLLPENQKEEVVYKQAKKFLIELSNKGLTDIIFEKRLNEIVRNLGYLTDNKPLQELKNLIQSIINEKIPIFTI